MQAERGLFIEPFDESRRGVVPDAQPVASLYTSGRSVPTKGRLRNRSP